MLRDFLLLIIITLFSVGTHACETWVVEIKDRISGASGIYTGYISGIHVPGIEEAVSKGYVP